MKVFQIWLQLTALLYGVSSIIIPDQLVSLLTLVYSTIPPVEKGTDSRFGVGFRLGPFADLQLLFELGPQRYTQPIGVAGNALTPGKRYTPPIDPLELQRLVKAHTQRESRSRSSFQNTNSIVFNTDPVVERSKAWLSRWRSSLVTPGPAVVPSEVPPEPSVAIQQMLPIQKTQTKAGYSESRNSGNPSTTGFREQLPTVVWNYPNLQRLRQLYTMAAKGG